MKKIQYSIILMVLFSLVPMAVSAQLSKQGRVRKNSSMFSTPDTDSVSFNKTDAFSDGNGVLIKWETKFELDNLGFNIYRIDGAKTIKINRNLIAGGYLQAGNNSKLGRDYQFFDPQGTINSAYRIENISINRKNHSSQMFYSRYENDLTGVSNQTSEDFQRAARESNPIIINEDPNLPKELKNEIAANSSLSDSTTQRWVASQPGVKIGVKSEGIYRVTKAELQAAGFDVNSSPNLWQLYLNGIEQAINVQSNGDYIEFYGKGIDTLQSDTNIYFLIVGNQAGKRMGNKFLRRIGGNVIGKNYDYTFARTDRALYVTSLLNGTDENFFGALITSTTPGVLNFDLKSIDFTTGKVDIDLTLQGLTFTAHRVGVKVNGQSLAVIEGVNKNSYSGNIGIPVGLLQNGSNTITLTSLNGSSDISLTSKVKIRYKRLYEADQNQLFFYTGNYKVTNLTGFTTSDVRVLDLTYPDSPVVITNAEIEPTDKFGTSYTLSLPAYRTRNMYAFADSAIKQIHSITQNFPSTLSTANNSGSLIIIAHRDWLAEANVWATYRQNDGYTVKVIDVEDAYDEFGFGIKGANAITAFLNYAYTNWQTPPGYVFLMGDASYDPKNYTGLGFHNYVPIRMVDTLYEETGSDDAMVDFDDDGLSELSVGRIPTRIPQDVTNAFTKTSNFEQSIANAPARGSLCASDFPSGYDFAQLCTSIQNELPASIPTMSISRSDPNAKVELINAMNAGKYMVNYSGHGTTNAWANTSFFWSGDVPQLTNQSNLSIYTMLTCLNGYFFRPVDDSLSEALLKSPTGGAVATWSSSGSTTPDVQQVMAVRFFNQIGNNPNMNRLGDLVRDAKSVLIGGTDVRRSWVLLGDPTLKVK